MTKVLAAILAILLIAPLCACRDLPPPSCLSLLELLIHAEIGLPAGNIYSLPAIKGEEKFISPALLSALYSAAPPITDGWVDGAFFIPTLSQPCEFAVIYCNSLATAKDTARLLSARLASLRNTKTQENSQKLLDEAQVFIKRNYVFLIVSSDTENAVKIVKKACR